MAALGSQSIASSYEQILQVDRDGGGNSTTHVSVKDGDNGTTFALTLATDAVMITSDNRLEFGDTGTYIHQSADGVLDLVSDTEIEINATTIDVNGAMEVSGDLTLASKLLVAASAQGIFGSADTNTGIRWEGSDALAIDTGGTERMLFNSSGDIDIKTGDIFFSTAGKGICLGVTSNTDSNTLDDYEEGYHTATVVCSGSGSYTVSGSADQFSYTKIGRQITVTGAIDITGESSPVGDLRISLPETSANLTEYAGRAYGVVNLLGHGGTHAGKFTAFVEEGTAYFTIFQLADDGSMSTIDKDDVDTAFDIHINVTYFV